MALSDRAARLALSCVVDGGDLSVTAAVDRQGAPATWAQLVGGGFGAPLAQRAAAFDGELTARRAAAAAARFVVPDDEEWPEALDDLRHCAAVQRRGGVPFGLWLRGPGHLPDVVEPIGGHRRIASCYRLRHGRCHGSCRRAGRAGSDRGLGRRLRNRCCRPPRRARGGRSHAVRGGQWGGHDLPSGQRQVVRRLGEGSSAGLRTSARCASDADAIPRPKPVDRRALEQERSWWRRRCAPVPAILRAGRWNARGRSWRCRDRSIRPCQQLRT